MMEIDLHRVDYIQVGTTSKGTMKILPMAGKLQKIAIGDNDGHLQVFGMKKGEVQTLFKDRSTQKITSLALGGMPGSQQDRIFISTGAEVRAFTRKGKNFLNFNTTMSEPIQTIAVEGSDLFVCGKFAYNHYRDCKDTNYMLCGDKINDVICLVSNKTKELIPILACNDRVLRIIKDSELLYEVEVAGPPVCMRLSQNTGGEEGNEVLYGTADGRVGLVQIGQLAPDHKWEIPNEKRNGGVLCMDNFDMTADGTMDLILGRDDGQVEIFSFDEADEPVFRFAHTCTESITSVQGGVVSNPAYREIVCATYAGWVFGLTSEQQMKEMGSSQVKADPKVTAKISNLKSELENLQVKVSSEREKYQQSAYTKTAISAIPLFNINDKFVLNREDASYTLSLELQMPVDNVLLQSDVPLDLLDVEKNSAVVSFSACNPEEGNYLLATYRCQANTTRLELKIRSIEGQHGTLQVYITPRLQPKTCQLKQYPIKPLSLHQRTHVFDEERPVNTLKLTGQFSLAEMHSWIHFSLPEVPERPPPGDVASFQFVSTFLSTQLDCTYRKGEAVFRSDNISTISILKDVLSKEATSKKFAWTSHMISRKKRYH